MLVPLHLAGSRSSGWSLRYGVTRPHRGSASGVVDLCLPRDEMMRERTEGDGINQLEQIGAPFGMSVRHSVRQLLTLPYVGQFLRRRARVADLGFDR